MSIVHMKTIGPWSWRRAGSCKSYLTQLLESNSHSLKTALSVVTTEQYLQLPSSPFSGFILSYVYMCLCTWTMVSRKARENWNVPESQVLFENRNWVLCKSSICSKLLTSPKVQIIKCLNDKIMDFYRYVILIHVELLLKCMLLYSMVQVTLSWV